ncbi:metal-dependent hydrolase [Haloarcula litorea]|uniref:metal-dependent hydrolase n=1 Tax=Haloarcula litorea TaxID=3032579 RepID=UPI0023E81A40|nr:metal-dependent hydrolase [Halomicroarcula sp. GDY20]
MLFATHLLAAAVIGRYTRLAPLWLVAGAALPDLVDKPLASAGVVDVFHSVGHSGLLLVVAVPLALTGRAGLSAAVGWASHLVLDALHIVVNGRPDDALFLGWPLVGPADPLRIPPGDFFFYYLWTPSFFLEVGFWTVCLLLTARWALGRRGGPATE